MKLYYQTKHQFKPDIGTIMDEPSQTIQDEVRPLSDIIRRAMEGYPIPTKQVFYFDPEDIDAINKYHAPHTLDLTDLDALQNHINALQLKVEEALKKQQEEQPPETENE